MEPVKFPSGNGSQKDGLQPCPWSGQSWISWDKDGCDQGVMMMAVECGSIDYISAIYEREGCRDYGPRAL